ncbi:hypothetical protein GQ55_8G174300 [Panicum hallii var. hallii]|uniref:Uncharacterized protein n=1 Tax=Panicum hallii var. hallii TaxID=1504633 RepID=A0A2T7CNH7_9POAL|nr:hypothetical protein GQ55_8G174300 [Panicum hallii var. hallii]
MYTINLCSRITPIILRSFASEKCNELAMHFHMIFLTAELSIHMHCPIVNIGLYNNNPIKTTHNCQHRNRNTHNQQQQITARDANGFLNTF